MGKDKNLIIVTYYFPPLGGVGVQRVSKFCRYLPKYGWNPLVVAPESSSFYMSDEEMLEEVKHVELHRVDAADSFKMHEKVAGSRKPRIDSPLRRMVRGFAWPDTHKGFISEAFRFVCRLSAESDAIFLTAPPLSILLLAHRLKKVTGLPLIIDMRDPWVGNPMHDHPAWKHALNKRAERKAVEVADAVISTTRAHAGFLKKCYPGLSSSIHYLPNGFDAADFPGMTRKRKKDPLTLCYTGILGLEGINEGTTLYKALARLRADDTITSSRLRVEIIGEVSRKEKERMKGVEEFIELPGFLSHRETMRRLGQSDLAWLPYHSKYSELIVPAKTYEYIGSGTPILAEVNPQHETATLIRETGTGLIVDEGDVDGMVNTLRMLLAGRYPYEPKRKKIPIYDRRNQARKLAEILNELTKYE